MAITFSTSAPGGVEAHGGPMPQPLPDGRTGRVPVGCVFWLQATDRTCTTGPADHGNRRVGRPTHGLASIDDDAGKDDIATLLGSGWVTRGMSSRIPVVIKRRAPSRTSRWPGSPAEFDPDLVLVRLTAKSLIVLRDAYPDLADEGKPQCHIVPMTEEHDMLAASVGCTLSRVRTGMPEDTCAIPVERLLEVIDRLRATAPADPSVAAYAAEDARRFA